MPTTGRCSKRQRHLPEFAAAATAAKRARTTAPSRALRSDAAPSVEATSTPARANAPAASAAEGRPDPSLTRCTADERPEQPQSQTSAPAAATAGRADAGVAASTADARVPSSPAQPEVLCRDREVSRLRQILQQCLRDLEGTSIVVPGPPGTGKTFTVLTGIRQLPWRAWDSLPPACSYVNCMDRKASTLGSVISCSLAASLKACPVKGGNPLNVTFGLACSSATSTSSSASIEHIERVVNGAADYGKGMCILVLDELDHVPSSMQTFVRELFVLPSRPQSRLVLIGIANRLTLSSGVTAAVSPFKAGAAVLPGTAGVHCIPFHSYGARQILEILRERYRGQFAPNALELIAKRISNASGDIRAALAVCESARSAISSSTARREPGTVSQPTPSGRCDAEQRTNGEAGSAAPAVPSGDTQADAPSVLVPVSAVSAALTRCGSGASAQLQNHVVAIQNLPPQQQLLLCVVAVTCVRVAAPAQEQDDKENAAPNARPRATQLPGGPVQGSIRCFTPGTPQRERKTPVASPAGLLQLQTPLQPRLNGRLEPNLLPPSTPSRGRQVSLEQTLQLRTPKLERRPFGLLSTPDSTNSPQVLRKLHGTSGALKSATPAKEGGVVSARGRAGATISQVLETYKSEAVAAGLPRVSASQVLVLLGEMMTTGLVREASEKDVLRAKLAPAKSPAKAAKQKVAVAVSCEDIQHALSGNRMCQPLLERLSTAVAG